MCAPPGFRDFSYEGHFPTEGLTNMRKRRAESELIWEGEKKKRVRSLNGADRRNQAVQRAASPPSSPASTGPTAQRRRKRPISSDHHGSEDEVSSTGTPPWSGSDPADVHRPAGGARHPAGPHDALSKRPKTEGTTVHLTKVVPADDVGDGELGAFNSFQFWRTPLPQLDLSLLDGQSTAEITSSSSVKDPTEAMET
ncbi:uncharacterized protein LOC143509695 [Brachyhypopomus gauderio]|uniref:uncharacterized protein LOC143509695 n=1 Tax=Brachyhypopomus gauderio TaxID=698409 RepID=UPI0040435EEB